VRKKRVRRKRERWVVKIGSNMVASGGPILLRSLMDQVVKLKRGGIEVIWVSSGAISSAVDRIAFAKSKSGWTLSEKQGLSAIGQPILMDLYNLALNASGLLGAQVLLTSDDLREKERCKNLQSTMEELLKWDVVPILNENDAIATEEIKFGDNDSLSAKVAIVMKAKKLIILTDVDGLYEKDPRKFKNAKLVSSVKNITLAMLKSAGEKSGSKHGTGGMLSKLKAAKVAGRGGVETILVKGDTMGVLLKIAKNNFIGTVIEKQK
jgi:glutamate 5-kinase